MISVSVRRGRARVNHDAAVEYLRNADHLDDFLERGVVKFALKLPDIAANLSEDELEEFEEEAVTRGEDSVLVDGPKPEDMI